MNFQTIATRLATNEGFSWLTAEDVVKIAALLADAEPVRLMTQADVAAFAKTLPKVVQAAAEGKKIIAIKELREASRELECHVSLTNGRVGDVLGLKVAKDAVEAAFVWPSIYSTTRL